MKKAPQQLKGKLVTLHCLEPKFFAEYHKMFSPLVRANLHLPLEAAEEETINFLTNKVQELKTNQGLFYCIFDNANQRLIGAIEIRDPQSEEARNRGQLGTWLNEQYWGGGRYQEALGLVITTYFDCHPEATSINAFIDVANKRSLRAHEKFGFVVVGQKKMYYTNQASYDAVEVVYAKPNLRLNRNFTT